MSRGHDSAPPPDRRRPLPADRTGGEWHGGEGEARLLPELAHELGRLRRHPFQEVSRLEHEAAAGESSTTPAILIVGIAFVLWSIVALVVATAFLSARLLA